MDRISLREPNGSSKTSLSPSYTEYTRRSSQLPTPETSRSGYEPYEDDYEEELAEYGARMYERRLQPPSSISAYISYGTSKRSSSRRDSCNQRSPDSPPSRRPESPKLSLPPLKTILADGISSPPSTPIVHSRSFQPSPREPTYTSGTYKPPALYPYKKQRTDVFLEPTPWMNRSSGTSSPGALRTPVEPPVTSHNAPRESFSVPSVQLNPYLSSAPRHNGTSETPTSPLSFPPDYQRPAAPNNTFYRRESRLEPDGYRDIRYARSSERDYDEYCTLRPNAQYELAVRPGYSDRDAASQVGKGEYFHSHTSPNLMAGPYTGPQSGIFVASHGDYHLSKSRKRSNLPKESTDIMKQWFDQNIANPYPSEEQKAIFSNATGISMNQVSNWFINHRRRCPELRDKRERARGRERDDR